MSDYAVQARNLTVKNNRFTLGPLNFDIPKGTITCVVGRNGAGKTTLLKAVLGKKDIYNGGLSFGEFNYLENENEIRDLVAFVADDYNISDTVSIRGLKGSINGVDSRFNEKAFENFLQKFGIDEDQKINNLSLGQRRKLMLSVALSLNPEIIFLDELTANFDIVSVKEILEILQEYMNNSNHTIVMSTNNVHDVEMISDYVLFLRNGKIIDFDDIESLKSKHASQSLEEIFVSKLGGQL